MGISKMHQQKPEKIQQFIQQECFFCEILEFQFISAKIESDNSIVVPWKSKTNSHTEGSSKSAIEQRIALVQQNLATQASSPTNPLPYKKFLSECFHYFSMIVFLIPQMFRYSMQLIGTSNVVQILSVMIDYSLRENGIQTDLRFFIKSENGI